MIIKKWNGNSFDELNPRTTAQMVYNAGLNNSIFDTNDKIKPAYLPDSVFDSLQFMSTVPGGILNEILVPTMEAMVTMTRSMIGLYFVASSNITLSLSTTPGGEGSGPKPIAYVAKVRNINSDTYQTTGTLTMQAGDWLVITDVTGIGTTANPYTLSMDVVNNTYELATDAVAGIVKLGSDKTDAITGKTYGIHSVGGKLAVSVPWTDTPPLTNAGVIGQVLTNLNTGAGGNLSAADTILSAIGKLEYRVKLNDAKVTNVDTNYGLTTGATNGTVGWSINGAPATDVAVKGLGSAAFVPSTTFAPASHIHGAISADGKIGSTTGLILKTGAGGVIGTLAAGNTTQYLRGDGSWQTPPDNNEVNSTTTNSGITLSGNGGIAMTFPLHVSNTAPTTKTTNMIWIDTN